MNWFNNLTSRQKLYIGIGLVALVAIGTYFKIDFTPLLKLVGFGATS